MRSTIFTVFFAVILSKDPYGQSAAEIVSQSEEKMRGKTSESVLIISIVRPSWKREIRIKAWIKGTGYSMLLVQSPQKDKGIVFLKKNKEVWNWMPTIEKTIKLPPSMMSQSWMGTDFTNDDLVRESSVVNDYIHSFSGDTMIDNRKCYLITLIPKPDAAVIWGKLITCIDMERLIQLHIRFYDDENRLVNTMNCLDVQLMDGRLIPTRFEIIPSDKKNHKTEMRYQSIQFDRPIQDEFFTVESMKYLSIQ